MNKTWTTIVILILGIAGISLSAYLWSIQIQDEIIVPCTTGGCTDVLSSDYSKIFGVPMAVYGAFYYSTIIIFGIQKLFIKHKFLDKMLGLAIGWGILFSVYLRYLEYLIGHICAWCWVSVFIVIALLVVYIIDYKKNSENV